MVRLGIEPVRGVIRLEMLFSPRVFRRPGDAYSNPSNFPCVQETCTGVVQVTPSSALLSSSVPVATSASGLISGLMMLEESQSSSSSL